jgi:translation initiation factor IF-2
MGEAKRRGTFEERRAQAIEREQLKREAAERAEAERRAAMTPEEREAEDKAKAEAGKKLSQIMGMARALRR